MLRTLSASVLLALATACTTASPPPASTGGSSPDAVDDKAESMCPAPTDGCMNEENHKECLEVEAKCPGKVLTLESCPLQFACE